MVEAKTVTVLAAGDVFPDLEDGAACFRHLRPLFAAGDIVFGNCEGVYTDRPALAPTHMVFGGASPDRGSMFGEVGFDVMNLANNHSVDGGYIGLADTQQLLRSQGIATIGAGNDIAEATAPAIVERDGRKIAFLGFCAEFPIGYEAREGRPGLAPLRIETTYRNPLPNFWSPGIDPEVVTTPLAEDMVRLHAAIAAANEQADHVIVSFHWGSNPEVRDICVPPSRTHVRQYRNFLHDYEVQIARDVVERGADAVLCHHHASLRGVEIHGGKPIFYGLGVLMHHFHSAGRHARSDDALIDTWNEEDCPYWPFRRPEAKLTGVAVLTFDDDGVGAAFVPAVILSDGSTEPLRIDDPRADAVTEHLERLNAEESLDTVFAHDTLQQWRLLTIKTSGSNAGRAGI